MGNTPKSPKFTNPTQKTEYIGFRRIADGTGINIVSPFSVSKGSLPVSKYTVDATMADNIIIGTPYPKNFNFDLLEEDPLEEF